MIKQPSDLQFYSSLSINTVRTKLGGTAKAKQYLLEAGFVTSNGVNYVKEGAGSNVLDTSDDSRPFTTSDAPADSNERMLASQFNTSDPVVVTSYRVGDYLSPAAYWAVKKLVEVVNGQLAVIPHHNKNWSVSEVTEEIQPYLLLDDIEIFNHDILASIQVNKNHTNPLTVAKKFATGHTVIGHGMQNLMVKEQPRWSFPFVLWSTGGITERRPSDSLTDKLGEFHHVFGAIVILPDGSSTNVHFSNNGTFSYMGITYGRDIPASFPLENVVILGDLHAGNNSKDAVDWACDKLKEVGVDTLILHDALDMQTVNPHSSLTERFSQFDSIGSEILSACQDIKNLVTRLDASRVLLTQSNHPDMLSRYFNNQTLSNLSFVDFTLLKQWDRCARSPEGMVSALLSATRELEGVNIGVTSTHDDTEYGVTVSEHGNYGANGARGSSNGYFTSGIKIVHGHTHTPFRRGGVNCVGTMTDRWQSYMKGGCNSHMQSLIIMRNGKSQHLLRFSGE